MAEVLTAPTITEISRRETGRFARVSISGSRFGASQGNCTLAFGTHAVAVTAGESEGTATVRVAEPGHWPDSVSFTPDGGQASGASGG